MLVGNDMYTDTCKLLIGARLQPYVVFAICTLVPLRSVLEL